jgi:ribosomal protein L37AE/L43A
MNYSETLQAVNTIKALKLIEITGEQHGRYVYYSCTECGQRAVIKAYGDKKNVWFCPECKGKGHIISLVMEVKRKEDGNAWDYEKTKSFLKEKAAFSAAKITRELKKQYDLVYDKYLKERGISEDICKSLEIGKPKGKTMLSGCIAFTVRNEKGTKIAYYGIRIKDGKSIFHNSFNPELYLYNFQNIIPVEEVYLTDDIFHCVRLISKGQQTVCNFGLPYLSNAHLTLLKKCKYITICSDEKNLDEIMRQVYQNLESYVRVVREM